MTATCNAAGGTGGTSGTGGSGGSGGSGGTGGTGGTGGSGGWGTCSHSPCTTGVALVSGCHACVTTVCGIDNFCCTFSWDTSCVNKVATNCGVSCN
jgi:hypothetical protein